MIQPTVGRIVWYQPNPSVDGVAPIFSELPYAALVVGVKDLNTINIVAFSHEGLPLARRDAYLVQDDEPVEAGMCVWMPYQKGQAAKHDAQPTVDLGVLTEAYDALEIRVQGLEKADATTGSTANVDTKIKVADFRNLVASVEAIRQQCAANATWIEAFQQPGEQDAAPNGSTT